MLQIIHEPKVITKKEQSYIGIRFSAPYNNMFSVVEIKFKQLKEWIKTKKINTEGPFFLRYHIVNMSGEMELEVGLFGNYPSSENSDIKSEILPGGLYATQVYKGLGLGANKYLLKWIDENDHTIDKMSHSNGDFFTCRYEAYLTDQKIESRKKQWDIELSIKLID